MVPADLHRKGRRFTQIFNKALTLKSFCDILI